MTSYRRYPDFHANLLRFQNFQDDISKGPKPPLIKSFSTNLTAVHQAMASQVRVAVRVRPLSHLERAQGGLSLVQADARTVGVLKYKFTYDDVYDSNISQSDLYERIRGSLGESKDMESCGMLQGFLDGYNATILAYGQTGSGKTYTMGSEATNFMDSQVDNSHSHITSSSIVDSTQLGLIPRFLNDIFTSLQKRKMESEPTTATSIPSSGSQLVQCTVSASFLEVYGEEIHDLLDDDDEMDGGSDGKPTSLPIREDGNGGVIVVGLKCKPIESTQDALRVLQTGTLRRTTASTLMNDTSSRSHAVFTIYLHQTVRDGGATDETSSKNSVDVAITSRFTFVDLAGSERMKKTGAEGERAREGIEINKGLLALGNVINALADDDRLAKGEKVAHVPYRHSKLTRLLQDALGGNSQTLFLACVSPSDTNTNETVSTLKYANRARNIKNAPKKNVDAAFAELQRLLTINHILKCELVKHKFSFSSSGNQDSDVVGNAPDELLQRKDVQDYLSTVLEKAGVKTSSGRRLQFGVDPTSIATQSSQKMMHQEIPITNSSRDMREVLSASNINNGTHRSTLIDEIDGALMEINPEEDMALLDKLIELQQQDQEFDKEQTNDLNKIDEVRGQIEEKEGLLQQLRENLKIYHNMKEKYEALMVEVQTLETEKAHLAAELERAQIDPTKGCSKSIRKKLETVELSLSRAREETKKHQALYRKAEQDANRCRELEQKIAVLKHDHVALMKRQRESAGKHREFVEAKKREIESLKRNERKNGQKVSKLEAEVQKHKSNLIKRNNYCEKLSEKLKQTENHLMSLLHAKKQYRSGYSRKSRIMEIETQLSEDSSCTLQALTADGFAPPSDEITSLKFLLKRMVSDRVQQASLTKRFELRTMEYNTLMRDILNEIKVVDEMKKLSTSAAQEKLREREQIIDDLQLKLEVVEADIDDIRKRLPVSDFLDEGDDSSTGNESESSAAKMIVNLAVPTIRTLLWDLLQSMTESEIEKNALIENLSRKESVLSSFENEVDKLNTKIVGLTADIDRRRRISNIANTHEAVDTIERYENEIRTLKKELNIANKKMTETMNELTHFKGCIRESESRRAELDEKLTLLAVGVNNGPSDEAQSILGKIQALWSDMGTPMDQREQLRHRISRCLEDTCLREYSEATTLHEGLVKSLESKNHQLRVMLLALGIHEEVQLTTQLSGSPGLVLSPQLSFNHFNSLQAAQLSGSKTLVERVEMVETELKRVRPQFEAAVERRARLVEELDALVQTMHLTVDNLSENLRKLNESRRRGRLRNNKLAMLRNSKKLSPHMKSSKEERERILKEVEEIVNTLDSSNTDIGGKQSYGSKLLERLGREDGSIPSTEETHPGSLSHTYLDDCEKDVKSLKAIKSQTHISNAMMRNDARQIAKDMHLRGQELFSLVIASITMRMSELPHWWNKDMASEVCRSILSKEVVVSVNDSFTMHLSSILESLKNVSTARKSLSDVLNRIVRESQNLLLSTVESEIDSTEAHSSFQVALSRLPSLSKEYIQACIDEINTLLGAVDAMTQSEIEALTVLWEAFDIGQSQRGSFWDKIEDMTLNAGVPKENPFPRLLQTYSIDTEEWIYECTNKSVSLYQVLSAKLSKLSTVHQEVEKLKSQEDLKSCIVLLDSEIRIMNIKLAEFEAKASDRQRLTNKKINSATLLEEERFRRQIQASFSTKLQNLANMLHDWERTEGYPFDYRVLSEEVRALLENGDKSKDWVEQRTAFMHLKTVKQSVRKKAVLDRPVPPFPSRSTEQSPLRPRPTSAQKLDDRVNRFANAHSSPPRSRPPGRDPSPNKNHSYQRLIRSPTKERIDSSEISQPSKSAQQSLLSLRKSNKDNSSPSLLSTNLTKSSNKTVARKIAPSQSDYSVILSANNGNTMNAKDEKTVGKGRSKVVLPFGDILSTSPTAKENTNIKFF